MGSPLKSVAPLGQAFPERFYLTDHYRDYPYVLVRLPQIGRKRLREVLEEAWSELASGRRGG